MKKQNSNLKILLIDTENAPNLGYIWGKYEQNVIAYSKEKFMLSYSYMWLHEGKIYNKALCDFPYYKDNLQDDFSLTCSLHKLFDEADIIIAHNGNAFDIKMANECFIRHNLPPPSPYRTIDTLQTARQKFKFNSNKLDDLGEHLELGRKTKHTGIDLWFDCMKGDMKAWKLMKKYNDQDVRLLHKVYLKLRPWMTTHPALNVMELERKCPACNSNNLQQRGKQFTNTYAYTRFFCNNCGKWSKGRPEKININY